MNKSVWNVMLAMGVGVSVVGTALASAYPEQDLPKTITLTEKGKTAYQIVVPDNAIQPVIEWSDYLAKQLKRITGADFAVVKESKAECCRPCIAVGGKSEANGFEDYVVRSSGNKIILTGSDARGTALAISHFLERVCGLRRYDGWTELVPDQPTLKIPELNIHRAPTFAFRCLFGGSWIIKWRAGTVSSPALPGEVFGRPGNVHTFYLFTRDWPADREDLLAMSPDGKRRKFTGQLGPNFCYTNPDGRKLFKQKLRQFIEQDRRDAAAKGLNPPSLYSLCQNDAAGYSCHCPKCDAFKEAHGGKNGGEAAILVDFLNDLARDIAKDYPYVRLYTDAYEYSEIPPPAGTKIEPNIVVEVTRTQKNYYSPIREDSSSPYAERLKKWASMASAVAGWDYWVFYWDTFPAPYHNVHMIKDDLSWYYENGVRHMRIESEAPSTASFRSLKEWLASQLLKDLSLDDKALIDDFMNGFYGAAAPEMHELMDLLAKLQKGKYAPVFLSGRAEQYNTAPREWLDADFYAKAEDIFARAEAKVADAPEQIRINVARERIPVDISLLYVYDNVKPAISRRALGDRYIANQERQFRLRVHPSTLDSELVKMRAEAETRVHIEEINVRKAMPKPSVEIPDAPAMVKLDDFPANSGMLAKGISVELSRDVGNVLVAKFTDRNMKTAPYVGIHIWDSDEWEIMLSDNNERGRDYIQVMADHKYAMLGIGSTKGARFTRIDRAGFSTKSELNGSVWTYTIRIPLDDLPIKNIKYANFFRSGTIGGYAWSPTFKESFCDQSAFGSISFK